MLVAWTAPSHYLNQWWNINWTLRNKFQWNFNRNSCIFIQENALENVVWKMAAILSRPQCVNSLFRRKSKKTPKLAFAREIHRWPVNSPHKGPVTRKCFHFMTSLCSSTKQGESCGNRCHAVTSSWAIVRWTGVLILKFYWKLLCRFIHENGYHWFQNQSKSMLVQFTDTHTSHSSKKDKLFVV